MCIAALCSNMHGAKESGVRLLQQQIEQQGSLEFNPGRGLVQGFTVSCLRAIASAAESYAKPSPRLKGVTPMSFILRRPSGIIRTIWK